MIYVRFFLPHLKPYLKRIIVAFLLVVLAKAAGVFTPVLMKRIVDSFGSAAYLYTVPATLLLAYGSLRVLSSLLTELRGFVYAKVTTMTVKGVLLKIFNHLHEMGLRFHIERQTGRLTRDIERGEHAVVILADYALFSIGPTVIECLFAFILLGSNYGLVMVFIAASTLACYVVFTMITTEWRTKIREAMNECDSDSSAKVTDSLLNFETVKYFVNSKFEAERYGKALDKWGGYALKTEQSMFVLNFGQQAIVTVGMIIMLWRVAAGVVAGNCTVGDFVLVSALVSNLYVPLHFLGILYREIRQAMTDTKNLLDLYKKTPEIEDIENARPLITTGGEIKFEGVNFYYNEERPILNDISLTVPKGKTVALVGPSGSGKSTISRLLFRFYEPVSGRILIDGQNIREVTQESLRQAIGIVPQDTVLFNDTLGYNIAYGRPGADAKEVEEAAAAAQLMGFVKTLPEGFDTIVGERGLKLSGGEKQRVSIARTILKAPKIFLFDEATSSLDSRAEEQIQEELETIAKDHTTLIIAHRLSTVVKAYEIIVLEGGRVVERGRHTELIAKSGLYAKMWEIQARKQEEAAEETNP